MTDTITISRDLFDRLCEAAIEAEAQNRWKGREKRQRYVEEYQTWCRLKNEAVAIRDQEKNNGGT